MVSLKLMKKEMDDVRCFIDDEEVDCETFKELPVDIEAEEWIRNHSYGGSAET